MSAYYAGTVGDFLGSSSDTVLSALVTAHSREFSDLESTQVEAWREELLILVQALSSVCESASSAAAWGVLLEFTIPRRQRRIDAVILASDVICVLEFKGGLGDQGRAAARQVEDYALDLADFHLPSHSRTIVPFVVASGRTNLDVVRVPDKVQQVRRVAPVQLGALLLSAFESFSDLRDSPIDYSVWDHGAYCPVPTIIEAATTLYAGSSVREIAHSRTSAENLTKTADFILGAVEQAQLTNNKVICFLTGIPGAGKTLAGLNLAHSPEIRRQGRPASVFLSGNGPLVKILRAALIEDSTGRTGESKRSAEHRVRTFIQNVHQFVSAHLDPEKRQDAPERVIVFDEAQRAWSAAKNKKRNSRKAPQWQVSEPEMILGIMDRHAGWSVVVALVGGGQEIHEGEAGLAAWGEALKSFPHWRVLASPEAVDGGQSVAGSVLFHDAFDSARVIKEPLLHLDTFVRSPGAEELAEWVNRVLTGDARRAKEIAKSFDRFPIVLTREIDSAKQWLRRNTRGERRCGLVASSGATRLRAFGIETSKGFRDGYAYVRWFLAQPEDIRSSFQLEVAATEFEIQGLELDNVGVCWGGDFLWSHHSQSWLASNFRGAKWAPLRSPERYEQARNKYRVLLTRARERLIILVPRGDNGDPTLRGAAMDETADYLQGCGCVALDSFATAAAV